MDDWRDLRAEIPLHDCAAYVEIYFLLCESLVYGVQPEGLTRLQELVRLWDLLGPWTRE